MNTMKIEEKKDVPFIDIENPHNNEEDDDTKFLIIETIFECVQKILVTFTMVYFIFKII